MTRKRISSGLIESFSTPCESCAGRGIKVSLHPVDGEHVESPKHRRPANAVDPADVAARALTGNDEVVPDMDIKGDADSDIKGDIDSDIKGDADSDIKGDIDLAEDPDAEAPADLPVIDAEAPDDDPTLLDVIDERTAETDAV